MTVVLSLFNCLSYFWDSSVKNNKVSMKFHRARTKLNCSPIETDALSQLCRSFRIHSFMYFDFVYHSVIYKRSCCLKQNFFYIPRYQFQPCKKGFVIRLSIPVQLCPFLFPNCRRAIQTMTRTMVKINNKVNPGLAIRRNLAALVPTLDRGLR